jgi:cob(I)alamin adenosyltransferase
MPQGRPEYVPADGLTTRQRRRQPVLAVHTGTGKGKSTAAFGMALRAWSMGWPIGVFQFVKSPKWRVGEEGARNHAAEAAEGWAQIKRDLAAQTYTFYVLDEFTYPLYWGWVPVDEVVSTLLHRPGTQHVVITGRYAPQPLIDAADLVTEMTKIRHPMDAGRKGQQGIEW